MKKKIERRERRVKRKIAKKRREALRIAEQKSLMHKKADQKIDYNIDKNYVQGSLKITLERNFPAFFIFSTSKVEEKGTQVLAHYTYKRVRSAQSDLQGH